MSIKENLIKFVKTVQTSDGVQEIVLLLEEWMIKVLQDDARIRKAEVINRLSKEPKGKETPDTGDKAN